MNTKLNSTLFVQYVFLSECVSVSALLSLFPSLFMSPHSPSAHSSLLFTPPLYFTLLFIFCASLSRQAKRADEERRNHDSVRSFSLSQLLEEHTHFPLISFKIQQWFLLQCFLPLFFSRYGMCVFTILNLELSVWNGEWERQ